MRPRKERERESRRGGIIKATEQLLNEKNFELITMDDIAEKSDFAKASIYQYFKNKDELLCEVFLKALEMQCSMIEEQCLSLTDPVQAIRNYLNLKFEFIRLYPWIPKVRVNNPHRDFNPENLSSLINLYQQKKNLILSIIQRGQNDGIFIESDPDVITSVLISVSSGFAEYSLSALRFIDLQSPEIEMFVSIIMKGITKGEQG